MKKIMLALLFLAIVSSAYAETYRWLDDGKLTQWQCSGNNCIKLE